MPPYRTITSPEEPKGDFLIIDTYQGIAIINSAEFLTLF